MIKENLEWWPHSKKEFSNRLPSILQKFILLDFDYFKTFCRRAKGEERNNNHDKYYNNLFKNHICLIPLSPYHPIASIVSWIFSPYPSPFTHHLNFFLLFSPWFFLSSSPYPSPSNFATGWGVFWYPDKRYCDDKPTRIDNNKGSRWTFWNRSRPDGQ